MKRDRGRDQPAIRQKPNTESDRKNIDLEVGQRIGITKKAIKGKAIRGQGVVHHLVNRESGKFYI